MKKFLIWLNPQFLVLQERFENRAIFVARACFGGEWIERHARDEGSFTFQSVYSCFAITSITSVITWPNMPSRYVGGCGNVPNLEKGIGLHLLPYYGDDRPVALKRRKQWVDFAKLKRVKREPTEYSHICSAHFGKDCFTRQFHNLPGQVKPSWPR